MKKIIEIFLVIVLITIGILYFYYTAESTISEKVNNTMENKIEIKNVENNLNNNTVVNNKNDNVFSIKNKKTHLYKEDSNYDLDYSGFKVLEYDNTNSSYAQIYYILYDYVTDPAYSYILEIIDSNGNSLLENGKKEENIMGGIVTPIKIKKVDFNNKLRIKVYEKNGIKVENSVELEIDLSKELEEKKRIDRTAELKDGKLGNLKFKYISSKNVYFGPTSHAYSKKLIGENASFPVKIQYGNYLESSEYIDLFCEKNVNNLSLERAFESLALINKSVGNYGLSDVYGKDIVDNTGNVVDTAIVTFDEMIKICNGETIEKNGKKYNKKTFDGSTPMIIKKEKELEIGKGIKAIKYYIETDKNLEYYMFLNKDNLYTVRVPVNERIKFEVEQFLNSLEIE